MVLAMSRPVRHRKTGVYLLRKRVPADIAASVGHREITRSLGTKDPGEAKLRHAKVLAELEAEWQKIRLQGPAAPASLDDDGYSNARFITDREAHFLAKREADAWLEDHRDNPSEQAAWHPELYDGLWDRGGFRPCRA